MEASIQWLQEKLREQYGGSAETLWEGLHAEHVTSLRVNTLRASFDETLAALHEAGLETGRVSFYPDAVYLPPASEPVLRKLPAYERGAIYLQSLAAMIPPILLDAQPGEDILDMCAAPGGKTSQIAQLTHGQAMLTACEPNRIRCDRLRANLKRLGCDRVNVLNCDARQLDDLLKFDRILLDAPCSGSGTLRLSQEGAAKAFSEKLVVHSVKLQAQLLRKACSLLKRGGRLVYSTCSLLRQENDDQITALLKNGHMRLLPIEDEALPGVPRLVETLSGTWTVPAGSLYEGFYISVLEKTE